MFDLRPTSREEMVVPFAGRVRSLRHALDGIRAMLVTQRNARIHCLTTAAVCAMGWACRFERSEWCWIAVACTAVWVAEALNTAFESLCDVVSPDFHPAVARAKDVAAGGVLLAAAGALGIGVLVFGPKLVGMVFV